MRLLRPLRRHWDDVKGNAKWDLFRMIATASPWLSSIGTAVYQYIKEMPWWEFVVWLVAVHVITWLLAVFVSEIVWNLRSPSLEVTLEGDNVVSFGNEMPSVGCRLFIRNPHSKTLEIVLVRVNQMDTNAARLRGNVVFPVDLFRESEGGPKLLHPGEVWELDFLHDGKFFALNGKMFLRTRLPSTPLFPLASGSDYRLRLCILIKDFPMHDERYALRIAQGNPDFVIARFVRIPRWKTVH